MMFTLFFQKLRKGFGVSASKRPADLNYVEFDEELVDLATRVPDDVKEGYFTVFTVKGMEIQRFVIELDNLTNPAFLSLLAGLGKNMDSIRTGAFSSMSTSRIAGHFRSMEINEAGVEGWTKHVASLETY